MHVSAVCRGIAVACAWKRTRYIARIAGLVSTCTSFMTFKDSICVRQNTTGWTQKFARQPWQCPQAVLPAKIVIFECDTIRGVVDCPVFVCCWFRQQNWFAVVIYPFSGVNKRCVDVPSHAFLVQIGVAFGLHKVRMCLR